MKTLKTHIGIFRTRPFYEQHEIESMCIDELRKTSLLPDEPNPIRIDRFIEKRFGISPEYREMDEGVLGYTSFNNDGVESIVIARRFSENDTQSTERLERSTLAHEAGHGLFQGHLFALGKKPPSLFGDGITEPKILCREENRRVSKKTVYHDKWWEYQANQAIGALLLPQPLVQKALDALFTKKGSFGTFILEEVDRERATNLLADIFNVNPAAARVRIETLYPLSSTRQLTL